MNYEKETKRMMSDEKERKEQWIKGNEKNDK